MKIPLKPLRTALVTAALAMGMVQTADASLLAYYTFEGNANDVTGNGFHGTVNGATPTAAGFSGQAYDFDGSNDFIALAGLNINPGVHSALTMGAWVRATTNVGLGARQVISHDNGGFDRSLGMDFRDGGGTPRDWSMFTGTGGVLGSGIDVALGEWVFLAAVYDQVAGISRLHVNGANFSRGGTSLGSGHAFTHIGRNPTFGEWFGGTIDNVFFFDEALTVAQIEDIRRNGINLDPGPTVSAPAPLTLLALGMAVMGTFRGRRR